MPDQARMRFAENMQRAVERHPEVEVLRDAKWIDACTNSFIRNMSKKLWLYTLSDGQIDSLAKAVKGYLHHLELKASATPVVAGGQIIAGVVTSIREAHNELPRKTYKITVRDDRGFTVYVTLTKAMRLQLEEQGQTEQDIVGRPITFYAYITRSDRDETFGFAHRPRLEQIKERQNAGR